MRRSLALALAMFAAAPAVAAERTLEFGRFGTVMLYGNDPRPVQVVLFVSGDGGWNKGVVDMARELAATGALVVGIDIVHYLKQLAAAKESCLYPAAEFEALSQYVQMKLALPAYHPPVLVGYSSGATLVYAVLVQAPPNTFAGAISLGFCPDFPKTRPFCRGNGLAWEPGKNGKGVNFLAAPTLEQPWVALQGTIDQVCDPAATARFVAAVPHGRIVMLPKVGHGFAVPRNWMPQFKEAFAGIAGTAAAPAPAAAAVAGAATPAPHSDVAGLPLVEVASSGTPSDTLAVIVSGDGGWAGIDREIGTVIAARGTPVVGLNSLQYFWTKKTPEVAAADLVRILRHYLAAWHKERVLLVGYSRGAEVLPFMANRLPPDLRARVRLVALLGATGRVAFEFHVEDWLGGSGGKDDLPVAPEVAKLAGLKVLCVYGSDERGSLCPSLPPGLATGMELSGAHHFGGAYREIAAAILRAAGLGAS
jgi:type IV secretory pathway VirJ component